MQNQKKTGRNVNADGLIAASSIVTDVKGVGREIVERNVTANMIAGVARELQTGRTVLTTIPGGLTVDLKARAHVVGLRAEDTSLVYVGKGWPFTPFEAFGEMPEMAWARDILPTLETVTDAKGNTIRDLFFVGYGYDKGFPTQYVRDANGNAIQRLTTVDGQTGIGSLRVSADGETLFGVIRQGGKALNVVSAKMAHLSRNAKRIAEPDIWTPIADVEGNIASLSRPKAKDGLTKFIANMKGGKARVLTIAEENGRYDADWGPEFKIPMIMIGNLTGYDDTLVGFSIDQGGIAIGFEKKLTTHEALYVYAD